MHKPELGGINFVATGSFNPAIVHPSWLADKELIPRSLADYVLEGREDKHVIVSSQVASFVADWLTVQVTQQQLVLATVDQGRELDLRDLAKGILDLLPETPVDAIGINADSHFRADDASAWHAFGDRFLPKNLWEPLFERGEWKTRDEGKHVGMRSMIVEVTRDDENLPGHVRVELAPSVRIAPNGVYIGVNAEFRFSRPGYRGTAIEAGRVLITKWEEVRTLESHILASLAGEI